MDVLPFFFKPTGKITLIFAAIFIAAFITVFITIFSGVLILLFSCLEWQALMAGRYN